MPPREAAALVADIREAAGRIVEVVRSSSLERYRADWRLRAIVERQFLTIGEAVSQLVRIDPSLRKRITHSARIIAFRNILVHGYHGIDDATVWGIIEDDLPHLLNDLDSCGW